MASKIKVKCQELTNNITIDVLQVLHVFGVACSKVQKNSSTKEVLVFCNSYDQLDKLFSSDCISALKAIGCFPKIPPQLKARRTVIIRSVDEFIYEKDENEILAEVKLKNSSLNAVEVFKFSKGRNIKITFDNQTMANQCKQNGLTLYYFELCPNGIQGEDYIFKCYT